jgi:Ni/Fe-hydrogenase subunit HybB-like protein
MPSRTRIIKDILWFFALVGLVAGVFRMWFGLGATTNMSDAVPWGLWKIFNMVAGVALSTSGFTVGFLVYVLRLKQYKSLMKPAILLAFLGYGCSMLALLFDIGLPHRFWHPILMWNEHSFLFEVFWCVLLYFTVTFIELSPSILERTRLRKFGQSLHHIAFGVVIVGISLSSLHHSSLGSLFLVTPVRLHTLWYTPWLPLLFIISAMGAGMMVLVLVRILYARFYDPEPVFGATSSVGGIACQIPGLRVRRRWPEDAGRDMPQLAGLAGIAAGVLAVAFVLKLTDLTLRGAWPALLSGTYESWLFGLEVLGGLALPVILVAVPRVRHSPTGLGIAAFAAAAGLALNRLNVGIFGYFRDAGTVYFPTLTEWMLSIGVIAAAGLVFTFVVENVSVFDRSWTSRLISGHSFSTLFERWSHVWYAALMSGLHRVTLIAVFAIPLAWVMLYPPYHDSTRSSVPIQPAIGTNALRTVLRIDGDRNGVQTIFAHADHQKRLGGDSSCRTCHHMSVPQDRSTPCSRCHQDMLQPTAIFDHSLHESAVANKEKLRGLHPTNQTCNNCHVHGQPRTAANTKTCFECHKSDMWLNGQPDSTADLAYACAFREAMHQTCVPCHEKKRLEVLRPDLAECYTCHQSMIPRHLAPPREVNTGPLATVN